MTTALASFHKYRNILLIDVVLVAVLYLLPSFSHLTALPLYRFEPMRIAILVALLFTNRVNAYFIAFTIPLASAMITGHPVPFKALLMGIELVILVAAYAHLVRLRHFPPFAALIASMLFSKVVYYTLKYVALSAGWLSGHIISTPLQTQLVLAMVTAVVFGLIEYYRSGNQQR